MFRQYTKVKIYAEIGSVVPSASRETLEFDDQTKSYIVDKLTEIRHKMVKDLQDVYHACQSKYELTLKWNQTSNQRDIFGNSFEWNGRKAYDCLMNRSLPNAKEIAIRSGVLLFKKCTHFIARQDQTFYLYAFDTVKQNSIKGRVAQHGSVPECSYILHFQTQADVDAFMDNPDCIGLNMVDLSKINYIKPTITNTRNGMVKADVYEFRHSQNRVSDSWVETKLDLLNSEGVYVSIKAFRAKPNFYGMEMDLEKFNLVFDVMRKLGITMPTVYGIKERDVPALGNNWIEISDYIQQAIYNLDEGKGIESLSKFLIATADEFSEFSKVFNSGLNTDNHEEDAELCNLVKECRYCCDFNKSIIQPYLKQWGFEVNLSQYARYEYLQEQFLQRYPVFQLIFGINDYNSCFQVKKERAISILNDYMTCK
jgi:hypothetical protein